MSDAPTNPADRHPRHIKEYEDPHYHDEEPDIQPDDLPREALPPPKKPGTRRLPKLRRRRYED
jgi:hypothetical protein